MVGPVYGWSSKQSTRLITGYRRIYTTVYPRYSTAVKAHAKFLPVDLAGQEPTTTTRVIRVHKVPTVYYNQLVQKPVCKTGQTGLRNLQDIHCP